MRMKASAATSFVLFAALTCPALAQDVMTSEGQPICDTAENLREFIRAVTQKDVVAQLDLSYSCAALSANVRVEVIEVLPGDSPMDLVVKIRAPTRGNDSGEGYTLGIGLRAAP